jgi:uncharacterized protein (DUF433 family)
MPGKVSGRWIVKGTRIPVESILENAADGATVDGIYEMFEGLPEGSVEMVLACALAAARGANSA